MDWLTDNKIPVGRWARDGVDWLTDNAAFVFDAIESVLEGVIALILAVLQTPPALIVVAAFCLAAWLLHRSIWMVLLTALGFLFIINQGYWEETTETLTLVLASALVCMAIGVPVGIYLAHRPRAYAFARPVLDLMQTLPTFVYLIPAIIFFGLGMVPGLVATVVFVIPAPIRLTQLGISSTPKAMIEAGQAFGASGTQLLWKVELPSAMPQIMAGLTQTIMLSLSMVVIAALVGADGLGIPIVRALNTVNIGLGFEAGIVIVVVAIILDRLLRRSEKA
ncbi:choline ABC transporter permease subunit [Pseudahrensia aquimaris]|uniref:Choline ABC transporter permease subunit n=1 Tax=Pseudahrensia aquimaris TaxID=744461 RepID=A0ABW3FI14_9HYPH